MSRDCMSFIDDYFESKSKLVEPKPRDNRQVLTVDKRLKENKGLAEELPIGTVVMIYDPSRHTKARLTYGHDIYLCIANSKYEAVDILNRHKTRRRHKAREELVCYKHDVPKDHKVWAKRVYRVGMTSAQLRNSAK